MAAAPGTFPEIDLDASGPVTTFHKLVFTVTVKQNGQPWASQVSTYEHASNSHVAVITGNVTSLAAKLGPKGTKPKNDNFDLAIKLEVDGQLVSNPLPEWNGVSREFILLAEQGLNKMWLDMSEDSLKANKAHGKV